MVIRNIESNPVGHFGGQSFTRGYVIYECQLELTVASCKSLQFAKCLSIFSEEDGGNDNVTL